MDGWNVSREEEYSRNGGEEDGFLLLCSLQVEDELLQVEEWRCGKVHLRNHEEEVQHLPDERERRRRRSNHNTIIIIRWEWCW